MDVSFGDQKETVQNLSSEFRWVVVLYGNLKVLFDDIIRPFLKTSGKGG